MSKKTDWYPEDAAPVHEGLYETRVGGHLTWSVWKDGTWHFASSSASEAVRRAGVGFISFWQKRQWRGLKRKAA